MTWFRRPNWLGETFKEEVLRRLEAAEGSAQEAGLRCNALENRILVLEGNAPVTMQDEA